MADSAMGESAAIFQVSSEALAATANPTGYLTGKAVGLGVSTAADAVLPDGRIKQVVVVVGTVVGSAYAGGATPTTWANMGANASLSAGQQAAVTYGQMAVSAAVTQQTRGTEEALWEVGLGLGTQGLMQTRVFPPGAANANQRRNLGEVIAQAPSATAARTYLDDNVVPTLNQDVRSIFTRATGNTREAAALSGAQQAQHHTPRNTPPDEPQAMPDPDPGFLRRLADTPEPVLTPQQRAAAEAAGIDPRIAARLWRAAIASGESDMYRTTTLAGTRQIADGTGIGKPLEIKGKSNPSNQSRIHRDALESKAGDKLRAAQAAYDRARQTGDYDNLPQARRDLTDARRGVRAGNQKNADAVQKGHANVGIDERTGQAILTDPATGKPFVADVDKFTSTASRPGEQVGNYGSRGFGTPTEMQHLTNKRAALGDYDNALQHSMEARNPHPLDLEDTIFLVTPQGGPQVINGRENIVRAVRDHRMVENPVWHQQAGIEPPPPPTAATPQVVTRNPAVTQQQINLEITRTQSRLQYDQDAEGAENARRAGGDPRTAAVIAGARQDAVQTRQERAELVGALQRYHAAVDAGDPVDVQQRQGDTRSLIQRRTTARQSVDGLVKATFGLPDGGDPPGISRHRPSDRFDGPVSLAGMLAFPQAARESAQADAAVVWQSAIHERVHAYASPAWRGEFEVYTPFHEGVVESLTRAVVAWAAGASAADVRAFPAFETEVATVDRFARLTGDDVMRQAYFHGDVAGLHGRLGVALGVSDLGQAETAGRSFVTRVGLALNQGFFDSAQAALADADASGTARVGVVPDPSP